MSEVKWIKIVTDIFDDEKILLIESMPEADSIIVIWFKLLCLAGKQNNSGVFILNGRMPYTDEMFATVFRRPLNTVRFALKTFEDLGMVEIINDTYTIPKWEKHQKLDALEASREATRQRVSNFREKQKAITGCNVTCNVTEGVTVTPCNADRIDIEEDKEKDIDSSKKERKKTDYEAVLEGFCLSDRVNDTLREFIKMRVLIKKPMTDNALKLLINRLRDMTSDEDMQIEILNQSIINGWQSIYPIKDGKTDGKKEKKGREIIPGYF